ncbi:MAG TPA: N-carbamoylputrescine amidase [Gammaproteobacteria bacterium]|nr:N-carbamoylputrescine amidase [Gammaproteobacteria bacterium]
MREIAVAVTQMACSWDLPANVANAERLIREAVARGAQLVLLQELFESPYFCQDQAARHFALAHEAATSPLLERLARLARELAVVLPVSFFERSGNVYFNSLAMIDADGSRLGVYRKSHIPQGPGYEEKFYFTPGDTGFHVWKTRIGAVGAAICWDQWFPEAARAMALMGAEILCYPTAIGSEPQDPTLDTQPHWQRVMQGHAAANMLPLLASNRVGVERGDAGELRFYGSSFIADETGAPIAQAARDGEAVLTARFDLDAQRERRAAWGLFRDRRPDLYGRLLAH